MTVFCEHCERADALVLIDGEIDATGGEFQFAKLEYACSGCLLGGTYRDWGDVWDIDGALVRVESSGTPIDDQRGVQQ